MGSGLLALALVLMSPLALPMDSQLQDQISKESHNLSWKKLSGFWYILAVASNAQGFLPDRDKRKLGASVIRLHKPNQLRVVLAFNRYQGCKTYSVTLKKDRKRAVFRNTLQGVHAFRVLVSDYSYGVVYVHLGRANLAKRYLLLFSRHDETSFMILKKFVDITRILKLESGVSVLPKDASCAHTIVL